MNALSGGTPGKVTPRDKRLSSAIARAALIGVIVHRIESDFGGEEFIASRWALTKAFSSLDALEAWIDRVAGPKARLAAGST